jgi:deoxyribonucleoside regulator
LEELKKKEYAILVAGGDQKIDSIYGALQGKFANVLVTDQFTARFLLDKQE